MSSNFRVERERELKTILSFGFFLLYDGYGWDLVGGLAEHYMGPTFPNTCGKSNVCWNVGTGCSETQHGAMLVCNADVHRLCKPWKRIL